MLRCISRKRTSPASLSRHLLAFRRRRELHLSAFIRQNLNTIVAEWEGFARTLVPATHMTPLALRDHCREILLGVADDMELEETTEERATKSKGWAESSDPTESAATSHGALRQLSGFGLLQLVAEFRALRASVLALWQRSRDIDAGISALEQNVRFNEAIDKALAESVKSYSGNVEASRDMLLAILGHDLRGPLSGVTMSNSVLGKAELAEGTRHKAVARIKRAAFEINRLIADLLEFMRSRLGAGIPIDRMACDLGPLCEEAIESIRTSHPDRKFRAQLSGNLSIEVDAPRLHQVMSNLLNNAVQHGDPETPVSLLAEGERDAAVLKVCNAGKPISRDAMSAIFEPFVQAPSACAGESMERSKTSRGWGFSSSRKSSWDITAQST